MNLDFLKPKFVNLELMFLKGAQTTATTSVPAASLSFGTTSTPSILNTTSTAPLSFGTTPASTHSGGISFSSLTSTSTSAAPTLGFGFGTAAATTSVITLGSSTATSTAPSFGRFNLKCFVLLI